MNLQSAISNPQFHEWLETDGLGGFASGTVSGIRTRRYHALLLVATTPPTGRLVLVNGFDAWVDTTAGRFYLTSQHYAPDVIAGGGDGLVAEFVADPWPCWVFQLPDGTRIAQEICVGRDSQTTVVKWRLLTNRKGIRLSVRPFLSGRDYHALHHANASFRFDATVDGERVTWQPYEGVPRVVTLSNGDYRHGPYWYRNFRYAEETARGLEDTEDLASPGVFEYELNGVPAVLLFATHESEGISRKRDLSAVKFAETILANEKLRRAEFPSRLHRAADAYIVSGRHGKTIIAGYPWFTDWGRDTFIAVRGLCIAGGRLKDAREILLAWANSVSQGMLPNLFPDHGEKPEFNSVDASLWYIIAVNDLLQACNGNGGIVSPQNKRVFQDAIEAILEGYSGGTRFGIRMDADGLLACGVAGVQLTWMDAKVGDWVVTPRIGKPVEVQALWLNTLKIASQFSPGWAKHFERGLKSFREKFWNEAGGGLYDVVDADHQRGRNDVTFRPNQIFAVGGLPFSLIEGKRARQVVSLVEARLWTPLGLRSLAAGEANYAPHYQGGVRERDGAYHQGTVWPWLIGPFVEAWVRVRGNSVAAKREARAKFLAPLMAHLDDAGLGHVSEIADAEMPHTPRGCPFQAWSLGELLRLDDSVLAVPRPTSKDVTKPLIV
jgi:predicted glycogen debranching enzyme